jgi:hypothetical protein
MPTRRKRRRRAAAIVGGLVALGLVAAVGLVVLRDGAHFLSPEQCTARTSTHSVELDTEQARYAGLIAAIAVQRGLPARAASIALAAAYQESKIHNLTSGDRDSLGLFQQRPSQGWGTREEILDPVHATNAFYDALVKVDGYEDMEITEAAQRVQRSGFPNAYADHEADARALASALTGNSEHSFACRLHGDVDEADPELTDSGLTERADAVRRDLQARFPDQPLGGFAPGGVSTGHMEGSAHYDGRAIDVFVRPVNPTNKIRGWAIAQYLVSQARRLEIQTVIFDDRIWTSGSRSGDGWRDYDPPERSGDPAILEHRDHVHVDVHE